MSGHTSFRFESLERRVLMSAAVLARGVLRVAGDARAANTIVVENSPDGLSINVTIDSINLLNQTTNFTRTFNKALGINAIFVRGGRFGDTMRVGQENGTTGAASFALPTRVLSFAGNDAITLSDSADFVNSGVGNDAVSAGDGNNIIFTGPGDDSVGAGDGNDVIFAGQGNDIVDAGNGDDWVRGFQGDDNLNGEGGNDRLNGGVGNDQMSGGQGDDLLRGERGDDILDGNGDNDLIFGGIGNDILRGNAGNDILWGGLGDDTLEGGIGDDSLGGVLGTNILTGDSGADTFHVRDLALNPSNDFDATEGDVLDIVARRRAEGPKPPAA